MGPEVAAVVVKDKGVAEAVDVAAVASPVAVHDVGLVVHLRHGETRQYLQTSGAHDAVMAVVHLVRPGSGGHGAGGGPA